MGIKGKEIGSIIFSDIIRSGFAKDTSRIQSRIIFHEQKVSNEQT